MRKVLYWRNIISDLSQYEEYHETIQALLLGEYSNLKLEKLNIDTNSPIYSIRHSKDTRIIFTTYQDSICILEVILNHDYAKSRFLKNRYCLKNFLDKIEGSIQTTPVERPEIPTYDSGPIQKKFIDFQQQFIELTDIQEQTLTTSFPFVLHGSAGSGKTSLAITLLQNFLNKDDETPVIYLTQSANLKNYVERLWQEMYPIKTPGILFLSYEEFITHCLGITQNRIVSYAHYSKWYQHLKKCSFSENELHQEFRILSGYQLQVDRYFELGERQSLFSREFRPNAHALFEQYQRHLGELFSIDLSQVPVDLANVHMIVDEAQDFSFAQLENILKFSGSQCALLLGDHQVLYDGISRYPFIKQFYYEHFNIKDIQTIQLPTTFRCSEHVTVLANELVQLKYQVTNGALDKIELSQMFSNLRETGIVEWFEGDLSQLETLKTIRFENPCALINFSEEPEESFAHLQVFNAYNIKGLEYETVILWKPFQNTQALAKIISETNDSSQHSGHRAKAGQISLEYLHYFNTLITAVTRSKKRLIIVHAKSNDKHNQFLNRIRKISTPIENVIEHQEVECNENHWLQQARQLIDLGYIEHAKKIFIERLGRTIQAFDTFKNSIILRPIIESQTQETTCTDTPKPMQKSPTTVIRSDTPSPKNQKLKPLTVQEEIFQGLKKEIEITMNFNAHLEWLQFLFEKYDGGYIKTFLTTKIENKNLIEFFCENDRACRNLIFILSTNHQALNTISSMHMHLLPLIKNKEHRLYSIINFLKKHSNLCHAQHQNTLLHVATEARNHSIMHLCLETGCDANILTQSFSAAHIACQRTSFSLESLQLLKKFGARFDILDRDAYLPLHYAIENERVDIVEFFIAENIDLNKSTAGYHRPLSIAVTTKNIQVFELLLKNGANPLLELDAQSCIVYLIVELGLIAFLKVLVKHHFHLNTKLLCEYKVSHIAAQKNQIEILKYLKDQGISLNDTDTPESYAPLHLAIREGHYSAVRFLVESGVDINIVAHKLYNITPAYIAAEYNRTKILELLHEHGAKFDMLTTTNAPPIFIAVLNKHQEAFELLLKKGFDTSAIYQKGHSLIHLVAMEKHPDAYKMLRILKRYKAPFDLASPTGFTPLMFALKSNNIKSIAFLMEQKVSLEKQDHQGNTAAHIAVIQDNTPFIRELIQKKVNLNTQNNEGFTPLIFAIVLNKETMAKILIEANVNLLLTSKKGHALDIALIYQRKSIVSWIIPRIQPLNHPLFHSSLCIATKLDDLKLVKRFLEAGISPNVLDETGFAPIHYAIHGQQSHIIELLAKHHANLDILSHHDYSPLMHAIEVRSFDCFSQLLKLGANANVISSKTQKNALLFMTELKLTQFVKELLKYSVELNVCNSQNYTALNIACYQNDFEIAKLLIEAGANIHIPNEKGYHCAINAAINHNIELLKYLVENGADIHAVNSENMNILHLACRHREVTQGDVIRYLIEQGIDINTCATGGYTALTYTIQYQNQILFDILLEHKASLASITDENETILHILCKYSPLDWVQKAHRAKPDFNLEALNNNGESPLYYAFSHMNFHVYNYLSKLGANIFITNHQGKNLLHWACQFGLCKMIQKLINYGVNMLAPDHFGKTPLEFAMMHRQIDAVKLLLQLGPHQISEKMITTVRMQNWDDLEQIFTAYQNQTTTAHQNLSIFNHNSEDETEMQLEKSHDNK